MRTKIRLTFIGIISAVMLLSVWFNQSIFNLTMVSISLASRADLSSVYLPLMLNNFSKLSRLGQIAFVNARGWISIVNADGTGERELLDPIGGTHGSSCKNDLISWSPDGKQLAYATDTSLYILAADGSTSYAIADTDNLKCAPTWSPDGQNIAFSREDSDDISSVYLIHPDGTNLRKLTDTTLFCYNPAWSPDGEHIAVACVASSGNDIYLMNKDGTGLQNLTLNGEAFFPAWSPDGELIAFEIGCFNCWAQIFMMDKIGGNNHQVTTLDADNSRPTWSPNRQWIAFESRTWNNMDIYLVDTTTLNIHWLTKDATFERHPTWSPDSAYLAYSSQTGVYVVEIAQGTAEQVSESGKNPSWSPALP